MEGSQSLVSIIVRTKDRPKLLQRALQSIGAQTYRPLEAIVVNDGGCDLDQEDLKKTLGDVSLNYIRLETSTGRAHAGNVGIENASGEYLGFLDDDDELYPQHVAILRSRLEGAASSVAYSSVELIEKGYDDQGESVVETKPVIFSKNFSLPDLLFGNYIPFNALLFRSALVKSLELDESFDLYEDWDLLLRCAEINEFNFTDTITAKYYVWGDSQIAQTGDQQAIRQATLRIYEKHKAKFSAAAICTKIFEKDTHIKSLEALTREKEGHIQNITAEARKKEKQLSELFAIVGERDAAISKLWEAIHEKEAHITNFRGIVTEKEAAINQLSAALATAQSRTEELVAAIGEKDSLIAHKDSLIARIEAELGEKARYIEQLHASLAWKLFQKALSITGSFLPVGTRRRRTAKALIQLSALINRQNVGKSVFYLRRGDISGLLRRAGARLEQADIPPPSPSAPADDYARWISKHELSTDDLQMQKSAMLAYTPTLSVLVSVANAPEECVAEMIDSFLLQTYPHGELCIAVNTSGRIQDSIATLAAKDKRIKWRPVVDDPYRGLSEILAVSSGDFVLFLDPTAVLAPFAFFEIARALNENRETDFVYSDEDIISAERVRSHPHFKPDWSPDTLRSFNYIGGFFGMHRSLLDAIGMTVDPVASNSALFDLVLRATEKARNIRHIAKVLFHARGLPAAACDNPLLTANGEGIRRAVLADTYKASVLKTKTGDPKFSLVILNKNSPHFIIPLLESLRGANLNRRYEVVVGDTGSTDNKVLTYYEDCGRDIRIVRGLKYHFSGNYNSLIRNVASAEYIGIMNNDIIIENHDFLEVIESAFSASDVGIVGSKLLYPNGRLQHGGIYFAKQGDYRGLPYHRLHGGDPSRLRSESLAESLEYVPAVTGAFLFCRREDFLSVEGLDENYSEEAQDVDFCLKVRRLGKEIVFLNEDGIIHVENGTRSKGSENWADRRYFLWKWRAFLEASIIESTLNLDRWS